MPVSVRKIKIHILATLIIFQDTITSLSGLSFFDYFDETLILCFAFRTFVKILKTKKIDKNVRYIFVLTAVFWLIGIISCLLHSRYTTSSLLMASILMVKIYILIMSLIIAPLQEKSYVVFLDALLFLGKVSAVTGIINFFLPSLWSNMMPTAYEYARQGLPSVMGLFIHAGQYGWFMLMVGLIHYTKYRTENNKRYFYKFIIYAVLACLSMKIKVVVGVVMVLMFDLYVLQKRKLNLNKVIVPLVTVVPLLLLYGNQLEQTYTMYFTSGSESARYAFLAGGLCIIKDFFPFGVGFGKFGTYYAQLNYSEWYYTYGLNFIYGLQPGNVFFGMDTFWPAIMGETGFIGTTIYILLLVYIFRALYKKYKLINGDFNCDIRFAFMLAMFVFVQAIMESFGEQIFNSSPQNIVIGIMIGYALSIRLNEVGNIND